jgi:plastocyanin
MKRVTRFSAVMAALLLSALMLSPVNAASASTKPVAVDIRNFAFSPKSLTVSAGTRVVWTNRDDEPHVVVSAGHQFASSNALDTSDSYAVTFEHAGTYTYYCAIHPMMVGTIIVQ